MNNTKSTKAPGRKAANSTKIHLSGPLTIRTIEQTRTTLLDAIQHHNAISLDCASATDVDLSFIQLLVSARKTAEAAGKSFQLAQPASGSLFDRLSQASFINPTAASAADQAFWLK